MRNGRMVGMHACTRSPPSRSTWPNGSGPRGLVGAKSGTGLSYVSGMGGSTSTFCSTDRGAMEFAAAARACNASMLTASSLRHPVCMRLSSSSFVASGCAAVRTGSRSSRYAVYAVCCTCAVVFGTAIDSASCTGAAAGALSRNSTTRWSGSRLRNSRRRSSHATIVEEPLFFGDAYVVLIDLPGCIRLFHWSSCRS